jgi:hypothetical protein
MKISIIIPTRERAVYLGASISTALAIEDPDLEVVVSDNASTDGTRAVVESFSDPRLIYVETGRRVSMRENFCRGLDASSGDYILFFGDDDAVLPGQFAVLRHIVERERPDGVSWHRMTYGWPVAGYGRKPGGLRFFRDRCYGAVSSYDPDQNRSHLLACRLSSMQPSPNIYHGCASREYLDRLAPQMGVWFDSIIPDVNFEYRSTLTGGDFRHIDHFITINGYSPASTGGAHAEVKQPGSAEEKAGKAFQTENATDPFIDVIDHALCAPLAFFGTLETVRARSGLTDVQPDYAAWYAFAHRFGRRTPSRAADIDRILAEYAERTGTQSEWEAARAAPVLPEGKLRDRWIKLRAQATSFRRSTRIGEENTVATAAQVADTILGHDMLAVMDGRMTQRSAWANARHRASGFQREL